MPALTPAKADRLYWLGRYAQRALFCADAELKFNVDRAYENGFLLRDLLDNEVFAHLRLGHTRVAALGPGDFLGAKEVRDALLAFWGILEVSLDAETRALCHWGRWLEVWLARRETVLAEDAWKELARCWGELRVGEPRAGSVEAVSGWFEVCFGDA